MKIAINNNTNLLIYYINLNLRQVTAKLEHYPEKIYKNITENVKASIKNLIRNGRLVKFRKIIQF